jgi:hypothetical protein
MFDIVVVASAHRHPLVTNYFGDRPHVVSLTPDFCLPENFEPNISGLVSNHIGAYRCFRGHQSAISKSKGDCVLILEDDAVPKISNWLDVVAESVSLLDRFDIVSFHGRDFNKDAFERVMPLESNGFLTPKDKCRRVWVVAALAYLVSRRIYEKLLAYQYKGTPWDLLLYWNFSFCLMGDSIFEHDRSEGSLIDV